MHALTQHRLCTGESYSYHISPSKAHFCYPGPALVKKAAHGIQNCSNNNREYSYHMTLPTATCICIVYCLLPKINHYQITFKGPIQPKYFYDYVSAVHGKVYWVPNLSLTKISYSNPQISSTYCMTLESFDGPILS